MADGIGSEYVDLSTLDDGVEVQVPNAYLVAHRVAVPALVAKIFESIEAVPTGSTVTVRWDKDRLVTVSHGKLAVVESLPTGYVFSDATHDVVARAAYELRKDIALRYLGQTTVRNFPMLSHSPSDEFTVIFGEISLREGVRVIAQAAEERGDSRVVGVGLLHPKDVFRTDNGLLYVWKQASFRRQASAANRIEVRISSDGVVTILPEHPEGGILPVLADDVAHERVIQSGSRVDLAPHQSQGGVVL